MKLAAVLACRNQSSRLYAKPLQNLDVKQGISILDFLIRQLKTKKEINAIVLAISEAPENIIFKGVAERHQVPFVSGDDDDVLGRLIKGANLVAADQVFRVTTESPYCYLDNLQVIYDEHCRKNIDYSSTSGLPDGAYFEIIRYQALKRSWDEGGAPYRNELCTRFIFDHQDQFTIKQHAVPLEVQADDVRLTVDWPEDLVVLRKIYEDLNLNADQPVSMQRIIQYLRANPQINQINNWIDSGIGRVWY
ncbi:MAG: acylneuraminate cytidylyltransferase [Candidatus Omnitrophica bacterium CG11_big_fil_rev_8_21_14_0_20_45_26]|uniref:Acylneuraminate cytidylyltransferase n=1 Tax=Candidatus Abzuiibacterium crystallinum TaxID=1974748 RepID=A0A2H0LNG9_9BACT|nr:MAG: acylneuraminate cytidylyltransferase [Candidatus Omnitrophica bacterium CG11_big_fil_rev_8_21_14_0_20_45_26]PIW65400.1 MAG: acylneuraminate cytidylyltransferase [Candidatus Omnitrophica bacterium CG12_big_fil_rev_8_21_14_0_65_45_16]